MQELRFWIADDGTKFEDEVACIDYERGMTFKKIEKDCICYDNKLKITTPMNPETVYYVHLKTKEAVEWWISMNDEYGFDCEGIDKPGFYAYNDDSTWTDIPAKIEKYKKIMEIMSKE